ncbi:MAG: VWA domain-containing protein [Candidatus Sungbacteria bacterium]|nr:VWA domain-containing protein [Candidatus Sungbacteria bacterium]
MVFRHPEYFWMIAAAGFAIFFGYLAVVYRGERILNYFGGRKFLNLRGARVTGPFRLMARAVLVVLVFVLFAAAYWMAPQITELKSVPVYEQAEVCFAIDSSRSSRAIDVRTAEGTFSRFDFAKQIVREAKSIAGADDLPCLIFFGGSAITTVSAHSYFGYRDVSWEYIESDLRFADEYFIEYEIPQGSSFTPMALKALSSFSGRPTRKILVVISDGEPERGGDAGAEKRRQEELAELNKETQKEIASFRAKNDFAVEFFGIGDITKPSPIPKRVGKNGEVLAYHRYSVGARKDQMVLSRPDPQFLFSAAQSLGGRYRQVNSLTEARQELAQLFLRHKKIVSWEKKEEATDAWQYFVASGLILLFVVPFMKSP